ncbi:cytochrome P450 93B2-like isoform X2 [Malania oleifera]|uniref:cytochrome P450 93B2-like isoform X2 n=1 Tax=Malania oleifera TaxID=397392 RepID=UPI0025AE4E5A|nr:cytochrome P450 93B2-like isoform X2 [Malania oleifera]
MILQLLCYATLFLLSFLLLRATLSSLAHRHLRLPPGPLALPVIGHFHLLGPLLHRSFHHLSSRYGPLIFLRLGSVPAVIAASPELAKELLKTNELTFVSRHQSAAIDYLMYDAAFAFAPYGPYWKLVKKLSMTKLIGAQPLSRFAHLRAAELRHLIRWVAKKAEAGERVNVTQELLKLTNNVISQMMLSMRCSEAEGKADAARRVAREVTQIFGELNVSDFIWVCRRWDVQGFRKRFTDIRRRYDALIEEIITEREGVRKKLKRIGDGGGEEGVKDFLDILLDIIEDENSEMKISRVHIKALILDFFTAGTDTSATAVEWTLSELINHPAVLERAREEIDRVIGRTRLVEESDSPNLPYIQAIMKESFRLHPPVPLIVRKSLQDSTIAGYTIPANTMLFVNTWSIGRDPNYWDNPSEFRPERFLEPGTEENGFRSGPNVDVKGQHFQLLPFGSGRRGCPGLALAMQELPAVLAALIQCFDWKVVGWGGEKMNGGDAAVDMEERPGMTVPRAHDLVCVPVARFTPACIVDHA